MSLRAIRLEYLQRKNAIPNEEVITDCISNDTTIVDDKPSSQENINDSQISTSSQEDGIPIYHQEDVIDSQEEIIVEDDVVTDEATADSQEDGIPIYSQEDGIPIYSQEDAVDSQEDAVDSQEEIIVGDDVVTGETATLIDSQEEQTVVGDDVVTGDDAGMIRYPTGFEVSDNDIEEKHFIKTSRFALVWTILPLSPSGTIDPSFKLACREGAEANSPLMEGSNISIFYVFDRERTIERLKRLDLDEDTKKRELISLGFEESQPPPTDDVIGDEVLNYDAIQNLQGDAQLRALMQASQHESEEYELALALSLSASSYIEPIHVDVVDIEEEGTSNSSSSSEIEEFEGYEEDGSFDYKGKWFVFDNRYLSIFLDMPFNERPTFISGKHKFSLTPDHWAAVKIRCSHVETSNEGVIDRLNEDFKRRYSSLLN